MWMRLNRRPEKKLFSLPLLIPQAWREKAGGKDELVAVENATRSPFTYRSDLLAAVLVPHMKPVELAITLETLAVSLLKQSK